jgi:hypothetical protein
MMGNAATHDSDWALEGAAGTFVAALIGASVAGAYLSIPGYPIMQAIAAAIAFVGDVAAIRCYQNMPRHYRNGRKYKFLANLACWLLLGAITIGSATLFLQWGFKVANQPHANQQLKVAGATEFLQAARKGLLSTDAKERKGAKAALPIAEKGVTEAMKESFETVQHIASGNELWYIIALSALAHVLLYAASGEDGKAEEAELTAFMNAKEIQLTAQSGALPVPPPGKGKPERTLPMPENVRQIAIESSGNVVEFTGKRKRKMPTAEEVTAMKAAWNEATGKPYTYQEIADHFGCSEKTCRNRVAAAKRQAMTEGTMAATA